MGRSMYNFGKQTKEKARQQKQLDKASKRLDAKQRKVDGGSSVTNSEQDDTAEPVMVEDNLKSLA